MIIRLVFYLAAVFVSAQPLACTLCHSPVAQDVRARLFEHDFLTNAGMVILPALILFGIIFYAARYPVSSGSPL